MNVIQLKDHTLLKTNMNFIRLKSVKQFANKSFNKQSQSDFEDIKRMFWREKNLLDFQNQQRKSKSIQINSPKRFIKYYDHNSNGLKQKTFDTSSLEISLLVERSRSLNIKYLNLYQPKQKKTTEFVKKKPTYLRKFPKNKQLLKLEPLNNYKCSIQQAQNLEKTLFHRGFTKNYKRFKTEQDYDVKEQKFERAAQDQQQQKQNFDRKVIRVNLIPKPILRIRKNLKQQKEQKKQEQIITDLQKIIKDPISSKFSEPIGPWKDIYQDNPQF